MPNFADFVEELGSEEEESDKANRVPVSSTCTPSVASAPRARGQPLTQEVITFSTNANRGNLSQEAFNQKLTHLQIQNKRIGPDLEGLRLVPAVYVLYSYDNLIVSLSGIQNLRRLQQLYLQNNRITSMAGLEGLSLLQKLHLGHNRLARIDSLESCTQLEELMVPHQQPPVEAPLQFCPTSIAAISSTLNVLNTAGNRLEDLQELTPLRLSTLDLSENKIRQVGELKEVISGDVLRRVTLQGNPFAFHDRRYRSAVVLCSTAIEEIDGREVLPQERDFVRRLDEQKRKLNAQRKKHLNRAATDGRPRNLGAMPEKGSGRQLKPAEGESWGLQDWKF